VGGAGGGNGGACPVRCTSPPLPTGAVKAPKKKTHKTCQRIVEAGKEGVGKTAVNPGEWQWQGIRHRAAQGSGSCRHAHRSVGQQALVQVSHAMWA
jgi:hypothetical protein